MLLALTSECSTTVLLSFKLVGSSSLSSKRVLSPPSMYRPRDTTFAQKQHHIVDYLILCSWRKGNATYTT